MNFNLERALTKTKQGIALGLSASIVASTFIVWVLPDELVSGVEQILIVALSGLITGLINAARNAWKHRKGTS